MAFKFACVSLFVFAYCSTLSTATPLSYLRDNDQLASAFPYQNQQFVYLNDNGVNQVPQVLPVQTVGFPNTITSTGLVQYPNTIASTNFINNVNTISGVNTLPVAQYPIVQNSQIVSYPSIQPNFVGGAYGSNQIQNTQSAPVEINYNAGVPIRYY